MSEPLLRLQFRRAKKHVLETILRPAGFERGDHLLVRSAGGQHHAIEFQTSKFGGEYFVNLAFSYDFLPPFFNGANGDFVSLPEYDQPDFLFRSRIGAFLPGPYQDSWRYDDLAVGDVAQQVEQNARTAVAVLSLTANRWANPENLLERLSPRLLAEDYRLRIERYHADQRNLPWAERPFPITQALGEAWMVDGFDLAFACAMIAWRSGRQPLAIEYLGVAGSHRDPDKRPFLKRLCDHADLPFKSG